MLYLNLRFSGSLDVFDSSLLQISDLNPEDVHQWSTNKFCSFDRVHIYINILIRIPCCVSWPVWRLLNPLSLQQIQGSASTEIELTTPQTFPWLIRQVSCSSSYNLLHTAVPRETSRVSLTGLFCIKDYQSTHNSKTTREPQYEPHLEAEIAAEIIVLG